MESALVFAVPHFFAVNRIHFTEKCSRASCASERAEGGKEKTASETTAPSS
jgi:hypothetical protein